MAQVITLGKETTVSKVVNSSKELGYLDCLNDLDKVLREVISDPLIRTYILNKSYKEGKSRYPHLFTTTKSEEV